MPRQTQRLLPLLAEMKNSGRALSLADAARIAAMSPWHLQREFTQAVGESPAKYQHRLRLERSAVELRTTDRRIIDVAITAGFRSHEAFTRAFNAHFGVSPKMYRQRSSPLSDEAARHATSSSRCVGLHHIPTGTRHTSQTNEESPVPSSDVTTEAFEETPTIVGRRRVDKERLSEAFAEILPAAFGYAMEKGLTMAGPPFVRYLSESAAFFDIEAGVPLIGSPGDVDGVDLFAGTLPGGTAATAIHEGSYDTLGETHIVLDRWISDNGLAAAGGPWEIYLTDPGDVPDPADWKTQIVWPLET